jgi:hypothetical protein
MARRIGGNAQCPCGSGFKFKTCCGKKPLPRFPVGEGIDLNDPRVVAMTSAVQRAGPQHGRLVPSMIFNGQRVRAVGSTIYWTKPTQTFHEFLIDFVKWTVGRGWYMAQLGLPADQRHQIMQWITSQADHSRRLFGDGLFTRGATVSTAPTGDELSLAALGYDLVHLCHGGGLPPSLVDRLRNRNEFQGALYEIAVAGLCARAGLEIDFIEDRRRKHPEFIARDPGTGVRMAVEAKSRRRAGNLHEEGDIDEAKALRGDVENLISEAMGQASGVDPFMIFVDVNVPPVPGVPLQERAWFHDVWASMQSLPTASPQRPEEFNGLFLTTFPFHWEGKKPATPAENLSVIPEYPRHPIPFDVVGRIIAAVQSYGAIPPEA